MTTTKKTNKQTKRIYEKKTTYKQPNEQQCVFVTLKLISNFNYYIKNKLITRGISLSLVLEIIIIFGVPSGFR